MKTAVLAGAALAASVTFAQGARHGRVAKVVVQYPQGSYRRIDWTKPLTRRPTELELDFPDVQAGVRGMRFVEAMVASARDGNTWKTVSTERSKK